MKFIVVVMAIDPAQRLSESEIEVVKDIKRSLDYVLLNRYSTKLEIEKGLPPKLIIKEKDKYELG